MNRLLTGALTLSLMSSSLFAVNTNAAANAMTDAQKKSLEKVIHDYLVNNPEVLLEASQALQQKQQQSMQLQAQSAIKTNASQLFNDTLTTVGNPKGNVTLVEFFDYQCIHCKKMTTTLSDLVKKDSNLRIIYKEFPIFGKSSEFASKAALAAATLGKYQPFHEALLKQTKRLTDEIVIDTAKSVGISPEALKTAMDDKRVTQALEANRALAEKLHLMGTPAFIVAATPKGAFKKNSDPVFLPGVVREDALKELIEKART